MSRILSTAKLPQIKGSPAKREQIANELHNHFIQIIIDNFEKNGHVTKNEFEIELKKLVPNINLQIKSLPEKAKHKGALISESNFWRTFGFTFELPFDNKDVLKPQKLEIISHELKHFFRAITEPKYLTDSAQTTISPVNQIKFFKFFSENIYKIPNHYTLKNELPKNFKSQIKNFFDEHDFSTKERIRALRNWHNILINEITAYKQGIDTKINNKIPISKLAEELKLNNNIHLHFKIQGDKISYESSKYATLEEKIKALGEYVKNVKERLEKKKIDNRFHFQDKAEIIKEMFFEEIKRAKQEHQTKMLIQKKEDEANIMLKLRKILKKLTLLFHELPYDISK